MLHHLRKMFLEYYKLFRVIFNKNIAIGVLHHSSIQDSLNTDDENEIDNEYLHGKVHVNLDDDDEKEEDSSRGDRVIGNGNQTVKVQHLNSKK